MILGSPPGPLGRYEVGAVASNEDGEGEGEWGGGGLCMWGPGVCGKLYEVASMRAMRQVTISHK